jgi:hypothetical protein
MGAMLYRRKRRHSLPLADVAMSPALAPFQEATAGRDLHLSHITAGSAHELDRTMALSITFTAPWLDRLGLLAIPTGSRRPERAVFHGRRHRPRWPQEACISLARLGESPLTNAILVHAGDDEEDEYSVPTPAP